MSPLSTQNRIFTVPGSPILKEPPASTAGSSSLAEADSTSRCQGEGGVVCLRAKLVFRTEEKRVKRGSFSLGSSLLCAVSAVLCVSAVKGPYL